MTEDFIQAFKLLRKGWDSSPDLSSDDSAFDPLDHWVSSISSSLTLAGSKVWDASLVCSEAGFGLT